MSIRYSRVIAYSSIFGSLALLLSLSGLLTIISYPLAPFLKFDVSEVIDLLALYIGGYIISIITIFIHATGLIFATGDVLGPLMKFIAVLSMVPGIYLGRIIGGKLSLSRFKGELIGFILAINFRWIIMTIVNLFVLTYIAPGYLIFFMPKSSIPTNSSGDLILKGPVMYQALITALGIIASYNVVHGIFTIVLAYSIYKVVKKYINFI